MYESDVYFDEAYGMLYDHSACGITNYIYESEVGKVQYLFLKRCIDSGVVNKKCYDLTTPYGYGGPRIIETTDEERLMKEFDDDFDQYCKKECIVSEFVRFHPLLKNHEYCQHMMDVSYNRKTIHIDTSDPDLIWSNMKPASRNRIRKAEAANIEVSFDFTGETIEDFMKIYYQTMCKNEACSIYYFDEAYFKHIFEHKLGFIVNASIDGKIISSLLNLLHQPYMHCHLSATDGDYYDLSPSNILFYKSAMWGYENGYKKFHLGGGHKCGGGDGILRFKKTLNKNGELDFYTGKRIHCMDTYKQLCAEIDLEKVENADYFPLYRAKLIDEENNNYVL